jgi:hypothetical protein
MSQEAGARSSGHMATLELPVPGGESWRRRPRGSTRAALSWDSVARATTHAAAPEPGGGS